MCWAKWLGEVPPFSSASSDVVEETMYEPKSKVVPKVELELGLAEQTAAPAA